VSDYPWPDGKRAALCITFDMDAEAAVLAVDERFARRPSIMTHQQYGPVTAVPRLARAAYPLERGLAEYVEWLRDHAY
jgi:hypothetical protein